jgi:Lamin Tail Domain
MSGHVNFATLAAIGLAVGVAGGVLAWSVRTPVGRGLGVTLLVVAVVVEGVAVLGRPADGDQSIAPPVSPPVVTSPSGTPTGGGGSSPIILPTTFHHQFLALVHFKEDTSSGRSQRALNSQFVQLVNQGTQSVNLAGWTLTSASTGAVYTFPSITIAASGGKLTVHTGTGTDTSDSLHWGRTSSAWSSVQDTATLKSPSGGLEDTCHYVVQGDESSANC